MKSENKLYELTNNVTYTMHIFKIDSIILILNSLSLRNDCPESNIKDLSEEFSNNEVEVNSGEVCQLYEYNFDNR